MLLDRLRENLADFEEIFFQDLYQNRSDGPFTCHVQVPISQFLEKFPLEFGKVSRKRSILASP